jgi:hypothetical protein
VRSKNKRSKRLRKRLLTSDLYLQPLADPKFV